MTGMIPLSAISPTDSLHHVAVDRVSDTTLLEMRGFAEATASNTDFGWFPGGTEMIIAFFALVCSIATLVYTILTWRSQRRTESNTSKIGLMEQRLLLVEMIRHLYRNLVVSLAIREKMKDTDFKVYPSEDHLQKMKVNLEDIHLNLFFREGEHYKKMAALYMMLRNYNLEIDVYSNHLKDPVLDKKVKLRELNKLAWKCSKHTGDIASCIKAVWPNEYTSTCIEARKTINDSYANNTKKTPWDKAVMLDEEDRKQMSNYDTLFGPEFGGDEVEQFYQHLEEDIRKECGKKEETYIELLQMIDLPKT